MNLWSAYVVRLLHNSAASNEAEFLAPLTVQQGTFNRWKNGKSVPTSAAAVAEFARELGRNPLEAFVAAGMLELDEAGRGLGAEERDFLELVAGLAGKVNPGDTIMVPGRPALTHRIYGGEMLPPILDPAAGDGAFTAMVRAYLDSNVFLYSHDEGAPKKDAPADLAIQHNDGTFTRIDLRWTNPNAEEMAVAVETGFLPVIRQAFAKAKTELEREAMTHDGEEAAQFDRKLLDLELAKLKIEREIDQHLADAPVPTDDEDMAAKPIQLFPGHAHDFSSFDDADEAARDEDREKPRID